MSGSNTRHMLSCSLCVIGAVLIVHAAEMQTASRIVSPPPIEAPATAREQLVTGVCDFGGCPVATNLTEVSKTLQVETSQNLATTSQPSTKPTPEEPEQVEAPEPVTFPAEEPEEPVWQGGRTVTCYVTAYCGCSSCSEGWGSMTATGVYAQPYHTIAVDPSVIPYGTQVEINGTVYTAEDCGGGVNGYSIDVYCAEHWQCEAWATGWYDVTIY